MHPSIRARHLSSCHLLLLAVFATDAAGCAYRVPPTHIPDSLPAFSAADIDPAAVTVVDLARGDDPEVLADARRETVELLVRAARQRPVAKASAPVRVRVRVELEDRRDIYDSMREDGCAAMVWLFAPFGMVIGREKLSAEVMLESAGRTFRGRGSAEKLGSIYAPARRRALSVALDRALAAAAPR